MGKKKKWAAYGAVSATKYLGIVEAETEEEAKALAWELDTASVSVCCQCSDEVSDPEVTDIVVEEEEVEDDEDED